MHFILILNSLLKHHKVRKCVCNNLFFAQAYASLDVEGMDHCKIKDNAEMLKPLF